MWNEDWSSHVVFKDTSPTQSPNEIILISDKQYYA